VNATTTVAVDPVAARAFLNVLYHGVTDGWVAINWLMTKTGNNRGGIGTEWFRPDELDAMAWCMERHADTCVWHGVAFRREKLAWGERGGIKDCTTITALWADLDVDGLRTDLNGQPASGHSQKAKLYPTLDAAYKALTALPIEPSIIVESGGGLQPYWLLEEPHLLDGSDLLERWRETFTNRIEIADAVFNADRILRLPGSINNKRDLVPVPVLIAKTNGDPPRRYTITELFDVLDKVPERKAPPSSNGTGNRSRPVSESWMDQIVTDFNERTSWADILAGEFEYLETKGTVDYWHAVDAEHEVGATSNAKGTDRLVVFSQTAGDRTGWRVHGSERTTSSYDRFGAHMLLTTGQDPIDDTAARTEFARGLQSRGYGPSTDDLPWINTSSNGQRSHDDHPFWTARPELRHIRTYAQAQIAAPWATLGAVLARIVCQVPPAVVLPDIINDEASLNLTLALVGRSGDGKGGAVAVARRAVDIGTPQFQVHTLGSGQGIAHGYAHWESGRDGEPGGVVQHATSVMFNVEEVDHLTAHNNQNASTALAELRRFCMGEKLGHLYADRTRRIEIPAHNYRGALIVGAQPTRAGVILNDTDGGTPQRFTWWPTIDHDPPDIEPERPDPWQWKLPPELPQPNPFTGRRPLLVCQAVWDAVREARRARNRDEGDPLDGHAILTRERIAAALGLLNGHWGITDEDWDLAGQAMAISDATRAGVATALAASARVANSARAHAEADRDEVKEDRQDQRVARRLMDILRRGGDWVNGSDLRRRLTSRDRQAFESAITKLTAAGQIESEPIPQDAPTSRPGTRYRVVEP
jgi:hypothetical protein